MFSSLRNGRTLVALAFALAIGALIATLSVSLYNLNLLHNTAEDAIEARAVRTLTREFVDVIVDAETGQRGFLLTGDAAYLRPYHVAEERMHLLRMELPRALQAVGIREDDPFVVDLMVASDEKMADLKETIETFNKHGGKKALALVMTDRGLTLMTDIKDLEMALLERIQRCAEDLELTSADARSFAILSTFGSGLLTFLVICFAFYMTDRQDLLRRNAQVRAEGYARTLTDIADVSLMLHRARDRESLLGMAAAETRRLLGMEVAAAVVRAPEPASSVAVGTRSTRLATWRPEEVPLEVGLKAETEGGFIAEERPTHGKLTIEDPSDLDRCYSVPLKDRKGMVFGHLLAAEPHASSVDASAHLSLVHLAQMLGVAWENVLLMEDLQHAAVEREDFMAMLGHELRNPLNGIAGAAQVLALRIPDDDPLRELVSMLERQSGLMRRLIEDLLDVARLERGKLELNLEVVDLTDLSRQVADDFRVARGEGFVVDLPATPVLVRGDAARLAQCLNNLLDNAVKFGDDKPITLCLAAKDGEATLEVRDEGMGIPPDQLSRIFQRYVQSSTRDRGGLGLGLALVHGVAVLHKGRLEVKSEGLGAGSVFTLTLPLTLLALDRRQPDQERPSPREILVVDDRADARLAMRELLQLDGHQVVLASNGKEAIELVKQGDFDVVFCDISMGDGPDGHAVARALRAHGSAVKLVALTGFGTHLARERSLEAGFDLHLTKPVDVYTLRSVLRQFQG